MDFPELLELVESAGLVEGVDLTQVIVDHGGWDLLLNTWRAMGGRPAAFAEVWTMVRQLSVAAETFAQRMDVPEEIVHGYVGTLQAMTVTQRAHEAEVALSDLSLSIAQGYEDLAGDDPDSEAAALGQWWRSRHTSFAQGLLTR
jgi:triacylglycerol esterase/lipase EstA (alpha/beta hydrolase family)